MSDYFFNETHDCSGRMRILCVDDTASILEFFQKALPALIPGAEVRGAVDPSEAMKLMLGGFVPDVLLLDYMMPGRSGLELAGGLKQHPAFARTCMLLCSAVAPGLKRAALNAGVYQVLEKPIRPTELAAAIVSNQAAFAASHPSPLLAATAPQAKMVAKGHP
jgi:two-component system, OmpR family, phosphate regulon response regulator PhoB